MLYIFIITVITLLSLLFAIRDYLQQVCENKSCERWAFVWEWRELLIRKKVNKICLFIYSFTFIIIIIVRLIFETSCELPSTHPEAGIRSGTAKSHLLVYWWFCICSPCKSYCAAFIFKIIIYIHYRVLLLFTTKKN